MWAKLIALASTSGGKNSDLNSLGSIHYGSGIWNSGDPLDIFGHSGSNILANVTNPMGSGLINGNIPNNGVNPVATARWAGDPSVGVGAYPGSPGMPTGFAPGQDAAMYAAYQNFLKNLGAPRMPMMPTAPAAGGGRGGMTGGDFGGGRGDGVGGGDYRGPAPGGGMNGWLAALSQYQRQPTMPIYPTGVTY